MGQLAGRGKRLNLVLALLPLLDVVGAADAKGTAGVNECGVGVTVAGGDDELLVALGGAGLDGSDEAGADPDGLGAPHERSGEAAAVGDTAGSDDVDGLAGQRRGAALALVDDGGDEDRGGDRAGVATALTALGADDVDALRESLVDVLGVADHVHHEDAGLVQLLDRVLGGDTDGTDEELGTLVDDDVNEVVERTLGVVVVGLAGAAADLGDKEVDTEGEVGAGKPLLDLLDNAAKVLGAGVSG